MSRYSPDRIARPGKGVLIGHTDEGQTSLRMKRIPEIRKEWCKGCRICVEFCPRGALALDEPEKAKLAHPEKCSGCGLCELYCPDLAIELR